MTGTAAARWCRSHGALVMVVTVLSASACRHMPPVVEPAAGVVPHAAWQARLSALHGIDAWSLSGRIAVAAQERGWNGSLLWDQSGETFAIRLIGPMGSGTVRVEGDPGWMHIRGSDGSETATADPGGALAEWLGSPLPVASLRWWVLGLPDPVDPVPVRLDAGGRAAGFDQLGWRVTYPRYTLHDGIVVPGMVVAENAESRLRVIVDHWEAGPRDGG